MAGGDGADRLKSLLLLCYSMQSARECNSRCFDKSSIWLFPTTNKVATNRYWLRHCSSEARLTQKHDYMDTVVPQKSIRWKQDIIGKQDLLLGFPLAYVRRPFVPKFRTPPRIHHSCEVSVSSVQRQIMIF